MKKIILLIILFSITIYSQAQIEYVAPQPGSQYQNTDRNIILRPGEILDLKSITSSLFEVNGSLSGIHSISYKTALDNKTIIIHPDQPFLNSEEVTFNLQPGLKLADGQPVNPYQFSFYTKRKYTAAEQQGIASFRQKIVQDEFGSLTPQQAPFKNSPSPFYDILVNQNATPSDVFFSNWSLFDSPTNRWWIIKNNGDSVYSTPVSFNPFFFDLNHNGYITGFSVGNYSMLDSNYVTIKTFSAVGYPTDLHEFQIFPDGHYYLFGDDDEIVDMTQYDPSYQPNATVEGNVIQEFDAADNLIFEWRTFDYFKVTEAIHENLANGFIDATHSNSLEEDVDGNIVVSFRHMDQIDKININNGKIMWRLGGQKNQFTFDNDSSIFNYQHDARLLSNGDLTVFDNNVFGTPDYAYAREYKLNISKLKATLVWSYTHPPVNGVPMTSFGLGSVQRLDNGNTMICWGKVPFMSGLANATEIDAQNNIVWEILYTPENYDVFYRTLRHDWSPCARPSTSLLSTSKITASSAKLNWNASTGAKKYDIEYQKTGASKWTSIIVGANVLSYNLTGLKAGSNYQWHIKTYCTKSGSTQSNFSELVTFKTKSARLENQQKALVINVFPNPAHSELQVNWSPDFTASSDIYLELLDNLGRVIKQWQLSNNVYQAELSLTGIPKGNYMIRFITNNQQQISKLVIE
ncbi:MAG: aryl-sulfate sulfotransferase [Chitinophagales bacterium]|nr:aryl-sulfate sulfotransferase [Chitinophagales bacterium]